MAIRNTSWPRAAAAVKDVWILGLNAFGANAGEPESTLFLPRLSWRRLLDRIG